MPVMQFRQVRVIMREGQVSVRMGMRFLKSGLVAMPVVVMLFMVMNVVMFDFLMPVRMRVLCMDE